jgi:EAL domain-containing protein (putative c-di-GMP-specific phosphodiesterase class I)
VNVSAKQFHQTNFVTQVQKVVKHYGINPERLKLELTESILLKNIEDVIESMYVLNKVGIRFSLDDFGVGYSSLQYLKKLPLAELKIDQSFVQDIELDSSDQVIVRTIIAMAHSLELNVIAEGVETEGQKEFLVNSGCNSFQGYLFGKPLLLGEFEALLES